MKSTYRISSKVFRLRLLSFGLITFERFSACFWRVLTWIMAFAALWLFNIPNPYGLLSVIFFLGLVFLFYRDALSFRLPSAREIDRRIEKDSAIKGRPLSGIQDSLANDEKREARKLWATSRAKLLGFLAQLRPVRLRGVLAKRDPYALRLGVFIAFVLGLLAAGPEWSYRIKDGLVPFSLGFKNTQKAERFTIVITPPEYTALPQIILNDKTIQGETLKIAQGSKLKTVVNGGLSTPKIIFDGEVHPFETAYEDFIDASSGDLILKQGLFKLGHWNYELLPDAPPTLSVLAEEPEILDDGTFSIPLSVKDDYGVQYLDTKFMLWVAIPAEHLGEPAYFRRSVVSPDGEDFEINPLYDLTSHPWAGLPVRATFKASDEKGQVSDNAYIEFRLPEREFQHPVAKTLVALRKELIWNPLQADTYDKVAYDAHVLSSAKELLHNDIVVYLALRSIALRLHYNEPSMPITESVMDLMWNTALRVEDGDLSLTARKLRDAQAALEEALQNPDITDEEISQLMQDLRQAMAEYLQELAREMQKRMAEGQTMPMIDPQSTMNQDALADFMEQMEQAMRDGDMASAQEMLSQMQRLMDMMNPSMRAQMPQDMQMMQEGINELQELIDRQEKLLEQTEKQADLMDMLKNLGLDNKNNPIPDQNQSPPPFVNTQENQTEQEALRFILGQLMVDADEKIGEIPPSMGLAEQEMRGSSEELSFNNPLDSIPYQMRAIEHLKDSQSQMMEQLQQRMVQMTGFMMSFGGSSMQHDPLGRPSGGEDGNNGMPYGSRVKIPDEAERRRVQEILKLLRQRAGQHDRPREELDYYRRLLKRF